MRACVCEVWWPLMHTGALCFCKLRPNGFDLTKCAANNSLRSSATALSERVVPARVRGEVTSSSVWSGRLCGSGTCLTVQCDLPEPLRLPLLLIFGKPKSCWSRSFGVLIDQSRLRPRRSMTMLPDRAPTCTSLSLVRKQGLCWSHASGEAGARFLATAFSWIF